MEGSCEHGNKPSGSIRVGKFFSSQATADFSRRAHPHGVSYLSNGRQWTIFRVASNEQRSLYQCFSIYKTVSIKTNCPRGLQRCMHSTYSYHGSRSKNAPNRTRAQGVRLRETRQRSARPSRNVHSSLWATLPTSLSRPRMENPLPKACVSLGVRGYEYFSFPHVHLSLPSHTEIRVRISLGEGAHKSGSFAESIS
jgi:hypothetical protein